MSLAICLIPWRKGYCQYIRTQNNLYKKGEFELFLQQKIWNTLIPLNIWQHTMREKMDNNQRLLYQNFKDLCHWSFIWRQLKWKDTRTIHCIRPIMIPANCFFKNRIYQKSGTICAYRDTLNALSAIITSVKTTIVSFTFPFHHILFYKVFLSQLSNF